MKKSILLSFVSILILTASVPVSAQVVFRDRKMYGPVPGKSINFNFGFTDGHDATNLTDHLQHWAELRNGSDYFDKISTSPYIQLGYEQIIAPQFYITTKLNFSYLDAASEGDYVTNDDPTDLDITRELKIYLFNLDLGLKHYFSMPMPRKLCPYVAGGFSAVHSMVRLNTDSYLAETDKPYYGNPEETVSKNSFSVGAHAELGFNYFITNRFSVGGETRFQLAQSDFEIHNANFDLKYAAVSMALTISHHF
ncbi:MAG: hypothetical protein U5O15_01280 [Candidatus Krumholzibacteriota bacterium]|nr:hypothetical protein [Candidatus Krumholzibacteriota bacterium]